MPPSFGPSLSIKTTVDQRSRYSDSRFHRFESQPTRFVRLNRAAPLGGGAVSRSEDGQRCAVAGKESLRIIRVSEPGQLDQDHHKSSTGPGGHHIEASRNFWEGSGLKVDSASTDVAWGHSGFSNKIITSARNGELIMWDLNKSGSTKYERRTKDHTRSINQVCISPIVPYYSVTASADGDMRVWDLRDLSKSILRKHHPTSVRCVVFSPCVAHPLQVVVGLDNGSLYRWDLKMGAKGQLDRILLAHTSSVTSLDWCSDSTSTVTQLSSSPESTGNSLGWLASSSLDRSVLIWDLTRPDTVSHMPHKASYDIHPSFPVRRVQWRPGYPCELSVVSNAELTNAPTTAATIEASPDLEGTLAGSPISRRPSVKAQSAPEITPLETAGDLAEIWDVRRGFVAKWIVNGSSAEGGITDMVFSDSHSVWALHQSGSFSQLDLRESTKAIEPVPRVCSTWSPSGTLAFVSERENPHEIPYDDVEPTEQILTEGTVQHKALGDERFEPTFQTLGTFDGDSDADTTARLAETYVLDERERTELCRLNALVGHLNINLCLLLPNPLQAAFSAGKYTDGQVWLLLGAALGDVVPEVLKSPSPQHRADHVASPVSHASSCSQSDNEHQRRRTRHPQVHLPSPLPPSTPFTASIMGRRPSSDAGSGYGTRRSSLFRRPSVIKVDSPHERPPSSFSHQSSASHRHVGEAMTERKQQGRNESALSSDDDHEPNLHPLVSPALGPIRVGSAHPSPLSRLASSASNSSTAAQQWTEDEDSSSEDPSPQSTETDSDGSSSPKRAKSGSRSRKPIRLRNRSRSSTIASLAAFPKAKTLVQKASESSIRTVTAVDTSFKAGDGHGIDREETMKEPPNSAATAVVSSQLWRPGGSWQRSHAGVNTSLRRNTQERHPQPHRNPSDSDNRLTSSSREPKTILEDEKNNRDIVFQGLETAMERFLDEGNVQMCAMLVIVAPVELKISKSRAERYVEAYLDLLTRSGLHSCATYVRKNCGLRNLQELGSAESTLYTTCSRCRKPLLHPTRSSPDGSLTKGGFAYCLVCRKFSRFIFPFILFSSTAPFAATGGHQTCYRDYFLSRPLVPLPIRRTTLENLEESTQESSHTDTEDDTSSSVGSHSGSASSTATVAIDLDTGLRLESTKSGGMLGHLCAAGCGHYCWVVPNKEPQNPEP
ncbi:hypothetical protein DL96DRAFT_1670347 [Flagelloscypha sp. PMI_526]|nr:hypothetical protein DL96DRAFT_1670347 [Flagelloscypha sp. PMI_526]